MDLLSLDKQILSEVWTSPELWNHLLSLCDSCNSRFATTVEERKAGDYIMQCFHRYGLKNVHAESFDMPAWERGTARLVLVTAEGEVEIPCLALPGAHACDLVAEIIDFSSVKPGMLIPTGNTGNPSKPTPAAGLACEHAARIRRLLAKGPLTARLVLTSRARAYCLNCTCLSRAITA